MAWVYRTVSDGEVAVDTPLDIDTAKDDWHFLAVTMDHTDNQHLLRVYLDAKLVREKTINDRRMGYSKQMLYVGIQFDSAAAELGTNYPRQYKGRLDNLMLFNRALGEQDIFALYHSGQ